MFSINYATMADMQNVCPGENLSESEFELKVRDKRCYILRYDGEYAGVMVFNLIFDFIPFLTMFYLNPPYQRQGFGTRAMLHWEDEMRLLGYKIIMVSTQVNEDGQHFYRKMGYKDMGAIVLDIPPYEQPLEMFMGKAL
ncbi:MAG: GNAT family N-acetyltransferase [Defluviitaleaceae bacterium]|nr:GNAT family N-acetyltransferase [Defluviitaleaceae bacterium]MCL2836527.1 GNAT family N-acetyltransferase [Defluviitaleaceae bacterium]